MKNKPHNALRLKRRARRLTLKGLSARTGIASRTLSRYERRLSTPNLAAALALAVALHASVEELFYGHHLEAFDAYREHVAKLRP